MLFDLLGTAPRAETALRCVVAIPAKDEDVRLPACLEALAVQRTRFGKPFPSGRFEVVLFANDCADGTADLARRLAPRLPFAIEVVEDYLPTLQAHAGEARRRAMDLALERLGRKGAARPVIFTTDADSRVPLTWIDCNLEEIDAGADAVLGRVALDEESRSLPEALHRRGALEDEYDMLLTELSARLDPVDCNPWPHHSTISGASLAVTAEAYRRVGGVPRLPLGEDKALVAALVCTDAKIRFSNQIEVVTSARLKGRAVGGVADTLLLRSQCPDSLCDEALEPYLVARTRALWRAQLRRLWTQNGSVAPQQWMEHLGIANADARLAADAPTFGAAWAIAEPACPHLLRRPLRPTELPREIALARRGLQLLNLATAAAPASITGGAELISRRLNRMGRLRPLRRCGPVPPVR